MRRLWHHVRLAVGLGILLGCTANVDVQSVEGSQNRTGANDGETNETTEDSNDTESTTVPADPNFNIDSGKAYTTSRSVTLTLGDTDDVAEVRKANGSDCAEATWTKYEKTLDHTLSAGEGSKTVCLQVRNEDGGASSSVTEEIFLDPNGPETSVATTGKVLVEADAEQTVIKGTADDGSGSGLEAVRLSLENSQNFCLNDAKDAFDSNCPNWHDLEPTSDWEFALPEDSQTLGQSYTASVFAIDVAGNKGAVSSSDYTFLASFCGGSGASDDPYLVCDVKQLQSITYEPAAHYKLANDIDAASAADWNDGAGFDAIGSCGGDLDCAATGDNKAFTGALNGAGFRIRNLKINRASEVGVGLFAAVDGATIENLGLENVDVSGSDFSGALAGYVEQASISASFATGRISGATVTGGLVGSAVQNTAISEAFSDATVNGGNSTGGLIGNLSSGSTLTNCYSRGVVGADGDKKGGLVGKATGADTTITHSHSRSRVFGWGESFGGLVGALTDGATVSYSFASGNVGRTERFAGGLVGLSEGTITYSFATGHVLASEKSTTGSLLGKNSNGESSSGTVDHAFASGRAVIGENDGSGEVGTAGGLIGTADASTTIEDAFWHDHNGNGVSCAASGDATCGSKSNGFSPSLDPLSLPGHFRDGRKIAPSDEENFRVWGTCLVEGGTIHIDIEQNGTVLTPNTQPTCEGQSFSATIDVSSLSDDETIDDGSNDITLTAEMGTSSCTPGSDCFKVTRSLRKDTANCSDYTTQDSGFAAGNGDDAANAYLICDSEHLDNMRHELSAGTYFELGNNIEASDIREPIGDSGSDFNGILDGRGFRITGLRIVKPNQDTVGLFGKIENSNASIKNVTVENSHVVGGKYTGLLIGYARDCEYSDNLVHGSVVATAPHSGGMTGYSRDTVLQNNLSYADIIGSGRSGGLAGSHVQANGGTVGQSESHGHMIFQNPGSNTPSGGLFGTIGRGYGGSIDSGSFATGHVIGAGNAGGGAVGGLRHSSSISGWRSHGNVLAEGKYVGGLVGRQDNGSITNSYATGHVYAGGVCGGLLGLAQNGAITRSFAEGDVLCRRDNSGGLIGRVLNGFGPDITDSFATGNVSGRREVGGLVGSIGESIPVKGVYATGNVRGARHVGGLVGTGVATLTSSYATGNVTGTEYYIGGLVGEAGGTLARVWASGHVHSDGDNVGGLVGLHTGSLSYSFAAGAVTGSEDVGGLLGETTSDASGDYLFWHDFDGNPSLCIGNDNTGGAISCDASGNPPQKADQPLAFAPRFQAGRKAGASDARSFRVFGSCNDWSADIFVTASDGSGNSAQNRAGCELGHWALTLDLTGLDDGMENITVTAEEQDGVCEPSADCVTVSTVISKDQATCGGVYTTNAAGFAAGDGTSGSPYLICRPEQLDNIRNHLAVGTYFEVGNTLDVQRAVKSRLSDDSNDFNGVLDGAGFRVRHLRLIEPDTSYMGLFGDKYNSDAEIRGLRVEDSVVFGDDATGLLVGRAQYGTIEDVMVHGHVLAYDEYGGGAVGFCRYDLVVNQVNSFVNIKGSRKIGGVCGLFQGDSVTDTHSYGHVYADSFEGGGFIGSAGSGTLSRLSSHGNFISEVSYSAGALIGLAKTNLSDSYAAGNVLSTSGYSGGLVGYQDGGTVASSYAIGNVLSSSDHTGGLIGRVSGAAVDASFATGIVNSPDSSTLGAVIGAADNSPTTDNSHFYDFSGNPSVCDGSGTLTCTSHTDITDFHSNASSPDNEPVYSWDFTTPIWGFDASQSDFPVLVD